MARTILPFLCLALASCGSCSRAPVKPDLPPAQESPSTGVAATPVKPDAPALTVASPRGVSPTGSQPQLTAKPLTASGDNSEARFSPDGARILFVSRARPTHKQAQIYELHLDRMTEKRITFHDGDDAGPVYTPDGTKFLFASMTDEIKEGTVAIDRMMKMYAPEALEKRAKAASRSALTDDGYELYEQTLHGRVIERLTRSPGFDGDLDIDPKTKHIIFSSARSGAGVRLYFLHGRAAIPSGETKVVDRGARFSSDGASVVWSRQELGRADATRLMIAGNRLRDPKILVDSPGLHIQPAWHPSGSEIVFSSNMAGKFFNLFTIDPGGACLRRLTNGDFDQVQPAFSPDGKKLLFTVNRNGHQHIYLMDDIKAGDCFQRPAPRAAPAPPPSPVPPSVEASPRPAPTAGG